MVLDHAAVSAGRVGARCRGLPPPLLMPFPAPAVPELPRPEPCPHPDPGNRQPGGHGESSRAPATLSVCPRVIPLLPWGSLTPLLRAPQFFQPLGVRVALVAVEVWSEGDRFEVGRSARATLERFLRWRQEELLPRLPHDNAQLLT